MKIGELFVALGFRVDDAQLEQTERRMEIAAIKAGKLALVVNAVNVAMLAMVDSAAKAAVSLRLWEQTTGGSADELQRWANAARIAGMGANEMRGAVDALNDARAAFALGEPAAVGAWSVLGVNPTQDPFAVLRALRERIKAVGDPNLMRALLGRVGLAGVMPILQAPDADFAGLERTILTRAQTDRLVALNREFQRLLVNLAALKNQLAAGLAPGLRVLASVLGAIAHGLTVFTDWLNSATTGAKVARATLGTLAIVLLAVGAAIAVVAAAVLAGAGLLNGLNLLALGLAALNGPLLVGIAALAALAAAVALTVLMVDDFWTAAEGGKSAFDWSREIAVVDLLAAGIERMIGLFEKLKQVGGSIFGGGRAAFEDFFKVFTPSEAALDRNAEANRGAAWFAPRANGAAVGGFAQTNNVEINVDGARSPAETADAVNRNLGRELESAMRQAPVPNF